MYPVILAIILLLFHILLGVRRAPTMESKEAGVWLLTALLLSAAITITFIVIITR